MKKTARKSKPCRITAEIVAGDSPCGMHRIIQVMLFERETGRCRHISVEVVACKGPDALAGALRELAAEIDKQTKGIIQCRP